MIERIYRGPAAISIIVGYLAHSLWIAHLLPSFTKTETYIGNYIGTVLIVGPISVFILMVLIGIVWVSIDWYIETIKEIDESMEEENGSH